MTALHRLLLFLVLATASPAGAATLPAPALPTLSALSALPAVTMPDRWVHGAPGEVRLQVHEAAPGLWILRQSKASNFEAPFLYLLAGDRGALLLDTGAEHAGDSEAGDSEPGHSEAAGSELPLRATVDRLLGEWQRQRKLDAVPLVVAHSHGHRDHVHGDAQFRDRPDTRIVGTQPQQVAAFFGLDRWPEGEARFDLGGRTLTVLPLPGHEPAHIAIYDAQTASLFSGDSLYPGLLTVRDWPAYRASAARLASFAQRHRVERVLGAHIEMSARPGQLYPLGSAYNPTSTPSPSTHRVWRYGRRPAPSSAISSTRKCATNSYWRASPSPASSPTSRTRTACWSPAPTWFTSRICRCSIVRTITS